MSVIAAIVFAAPWIAAAASALFTAAHMLDESVGNDEPLWDVFGRLAGIRVPPLVGQLAFAAVAGGVTGFAAGAYTSGHRPALWLLLGLRVGDVLFSHWLLWLAGNRPNPGLETTPLYVAESVFLVLLLTGQF